MSKALGIIGVLAALWAAVVGIWGIVDHDGAAESAGDMTAGFLWLSIGVLALAVAVLATALSRRP